MEKEISRKLEKLIHIYTFCVPADVHTFNDFYIIQILFIFFAAFPCTFSTVLFTFFQEQANENKKKINFNFGILAVAVVVDDDGAAFHLFVSILPPKNCYYSYETEQKLFYK